MSKKPLPVINVTLDRIIGGGQSIGTLEDGKKCLVWGGLPSEEVNVQLTNKKSTYVEGFVTEVIKPSPQRVEPRDQDSYLSTSPWQIMEFAYEQHFKAALIEEAFELHDIVLPQPIGVWSDGREYEYRNKVEFSFWYDKDKETLDLAFFRRGTHGKIAVESTSLAAPVINKVANDVLQALRDLKIDGRSLKTLLIRSNSAGQVAWQLYVKDQNQDWQNILEHISHLYEVKPPNGVICGEIIYSNPKSPASVITKRLAATSDKTLSDTILDVPFSYATEGFFQINLPVYEQALRDMREWVWDEGKRVTRESEQHERIARDSSRLLNHSDRTRDPAPLRGTSNDASGRDHAVIDLYSGVGTIGLTIGGDNVTLIESNENAVREMQRNITEHKVNAKAVLAASENALEYITSDVRVIVDPPRAGLHEKVVEKLLDAAPQRIIYLSCNPVTQARDVARLAEKYGIRHHQGYNFFPRTPHIEHLVILDKLQ